MDRDYWQTLSDAEREQWGYVPGKTVGPLGFGADRQHAIATMEGFAFAAEEAEIDRWNAQRAQWRVEFRLIGRVPSELSSEMEAWALKKGKGIWFSPSGDLAWPDFDFDRGAQRAGDAVVSWAVFFRTGDIAGSAQERSGATARPPAP
ncbi:hypothetical protein [Streptomyces liangshanensis]|uniref:hypothetical protein n=1 Tax=Streptomyces liangshanensis TaxID=2717324 RepID=UPI0036D8F47E